ncbi:TIGR04372 family glycosyltransferase [Candidatus Pelagibacter bacterium nBUS_30]|uniref:TIGR04372 family glycosyltransferase n=1 Tax=Candidatus Pelagibacter bacterium nBUS_30 TaxID=3374191 RepID=UPI003EBC52FF
MNYKNIFFPLYPVEHNGYTWGERLTLFSRLIIGIREILIGKNIRYKFIVLINIIKHLLFYFYNLLLFPVTILIYFFNFRFVHISSWQIGSYVHQLDTIIKQNKLNNKLRLILLCPNFICSNTFISKIYDEEIICIKNLISYFLFLPFIHNPLISIVPWDFETQNRNSIFNKIHRDFFKKFKKNTIHVKINNLQKKYFKREYKNTICIHLRDNYYKSSNTDRNVNIFTLKKTINYLLKKKFKVIRFINNKSKKLHIKNKNYSELVIKTEEDKLNQFLIINSSRLVIGSQSGVLNYNLISETPFLLTNAIPINNIMVVKKKDMYIFKKFKKKNNFLSLKEIISHNYHINPEKIKKGIKIIDNNENEILNSTKEILNLKKFTINSKLKKKYSSSIKKIGASYTNAKISNYFLSKNRMII